MNKLTCALTLVVMSTVLVSCHQTVVKSILEGENGDKISHVIEPKEHDLKSREEFMDAIRLSRFRPTHPARYANEVLKALNRMDDTNVVLGAGLTVANLIKENDFKKWSDCSQKALRHRAELVDRFRSEDQKLHGIIMYLEKNVFNSAFACGVDRHEVDDKINDPEWLNTLYDKLLVAAHESWYTKISTVIDYILNRSHQKRSRARAVMEPAAIVEPEESHAEEQVNSETESETATDTQDEATAAEKEVQSAK